MGQADGGLSVLRTFRLLRVLKLVRFLPALRRQLVVLVKTMDNVATFCTLLMLFIFIFRWAPQPAQRLTPGQPGAQARGAPKQKEPSHHQPQGICRHSTSAAFIREALMGHLLCATH